MLLNDEYDVDGDRIWITMRRTFTEEEALDLLRQMPAYDRLVQASHGVDVLKVLDEQSPDEIASLIFEGIPYED